MGGSASAPEPPDTTRYSNEMSNMSQTSKEWATEIHDIGMQEWGKLQDWSQQFMGSAMPAMEDSFAWAAEQRDRFNEYVMPQMESLFSEAETYASKGQEDLERGKAIQDVKSASEAQRAAQLRKLEGYGVDPSETRYAALDKQAGVAEAAMSALAANQAGERTKEIGRGLRADAINVGTGFLQDANQNVQIAGNLGQGALGAAGGATATGANVANAAGQYWGMAQNQNADAAGIIDTSFGRELDYAADSRAASAQDFSQMMAVGEMGMQAATMAEGGPVSAPGGPTDDLGAIQISDGEYVIPADVVQRMGTNHFDKMIEKETGRPAPSVKQAIPVQGGQ
jgi:hypothetical protein